MKNKTISKAEAIETLYGLANSEILDKYIEDKLIAIINCLETEEKFGVNAFDMELKDFCKLCTISKTTPGYEELCKVQEAIIEKYSK